MTLSIKIKNATLSIKAHRITTLDAVMLSVANKPIMLSVFMLSVVMLTVVAPYRLMCQVENVSL